MRALVATLALTLLVAGCFGKDEAPTPPPELYDPPVQTTPASPNVAPAPSPGPAEPSEPGEAPDATTPAATAAPRITTSSWNETMTGAGASPPAGPACCVWRTANGNDDEGFEVPADAKGVVVELFWEGATIDLDLQVLAADYAEHIPPDPAAPTATSDGHAWANTAGRPGEPDGHATIVIVEPDALVPGTWYWRVGADGPANEIAYQVVASVFLDALPPEGYSAVVSSDNP